MEMTRACGTCTAGASHLHLEFLSRYHVLLTVAAHLQPGSWLLIWELAYPMVYRVLARAELFNRFTSKLDGIPGIP